MDLDSRPFAPESLLQHDAFVRRLAKQLVRDEALALDLAQSTWVSWLSRPVAVASPRALLATIARRLAGKQRRSAMRRAARERLADAPQPAPTPTELLAREEMRAQVVRAVLALPVPMRDVVVLRFFEGLLPRAIAARLALPVETVRTRQKRALAELKQRLDAITDGGRAAWCAALLPLVGGRASTVLHAAHVASWVVAKSLAGFAAAAALAVGLAWIAVGSQLLQEDPAPPQFAVVAQTESADEARAQSERERVAAMVEREARVAAPPLEVADAAPSANGAAAAMNSASARIAAWSVAFLVVDGDGRAIEGAEVRLYEAELEGGVYPRRVQGAIAFATLVSGRDGRAEGVVPHERCMFSAADPRAPQRRSGDFPLSRGVTSEIRIVLEDPVALAGRAFDTAGNPLAGAVVQAMPRPLEFGMRIGAWMPESVVAAEDGSFAIAALPGLTYELTARRDGVVTATAIVLPTMQANAPIELRVPSRATLHGVVLDDAGRGVHGARVHVVRDSDRSGESSSGRDTSVGQFATTAQDGSFTVEMPRHGPFQLVAQADGLASSAVRDVTTDHANPVAHVTLALRAYSRIDGRVIAEDGAPLVDAEVAFVAEAGPISVFHGIPSEERFGVAGAVRSDAAGAFAAVVHPGVRWTIRVVPSGVDRALAFVARGIEPGRSDVVVRVPDQALQGSVLRGRVLRPDGGSLPPFRVELMHHVSDFQQSGSQCRVTLEGDRFWTEPLPFGGRFSAYLLFEQPRTGLSWPGDSPVVLSRYTAEFAPSRTAALTMDAANIECELFVRTWGRVSVRVLDGNGQPAPGFLVTASQGVRFHESRAHTDPDGRATLQQCVPGRNEVFVWRDRQRLCSGSIEVREGEEAALELTLGLPAGR
jgi:RNA polymerase sigma-70 factor (ECF subfamily)